ncbi:MAG: LD-carboxypeptidase [Cyclonatronaceae bacterium]
MIKLRPLPEKGTIGIMAPSSPIEPQRLENGVKYFEKRGYRVIVKASCHASDHYLAGHAEDRASELMDLVNDPSVDLIFFARGGFGSSAMLPLLDYDAIRSARKLMIGYSDITALEWGIYAKTGLPSLSTGMPATDFYMDPVHPDFEKAFWDFMETGKINYNLNGSSNRNSGEVHGIALPGTLSVAAKLAGSPYFPDLYNSIPILEDVGEPRHKTEGYLWQARLAGWFESVNAVVFGSFTPPDQETFDDVPTMEEVLDRLMRDSNLPVVRGVPYGHIDHKIPFPLGVEISISFGDTITITSSDTLFDL